MRRDLEERLEKLLPRARSEAWSIYQGAPHALDLDELISLAYKGLTEASARWEAYCESHGYDSTDLSYFDVYCLRRIRGSMLDAMRSQDWLTRSMRNRAKALRDAGADLGKTDNELADVTGLTVIQVRETLAAQARRPQSFDAEPAEVAQDGGVEEDVVVSSILEAVAQAMETLSERGRAVLALRYYAGWGMDEVAEALALPEGEAAKLHNAAIDAVHQAMLKAAV